MRGVLRDFFNKRNIEYFCVLDFSCLRVSSSAIMDREDFTPRSAIIYLLPYYTGECVNLSRYAASLDYHLAIREINEELIDLIRERCPNARAKGYGDHSPIDERDAALRGGLGILGDNGLLINEKYGTYIFIADVISDVDAELLCASAPVEIRHCEGCGACRLSCPTGVLRGESLDCLSAITQKKGELSASETALMRKYNTAWGCDICQSACPHNNAPRLTPVLFFYKDRISELTTEILDGMDKRSFNLRAFAWRGRTTVKRNLGILEKKD